MQDQKPVYFASKALTETQCGYVAIEIEFLAVAWAMGEIPSLLVPKPFYPGKQDQKASGSNFVQKPQPGNTQVAEDPDKNISIQVYW